MTGELQARRAAPSPSRAADRIIGRWRGEAPGPTLICIGGVHGNEPAGVEALRRVFTDLSTRRPASRGELLGLAGNLSALARRRRYVTRDLNRLWSEERVAARISNRQSLISEEREMLQLLDELVAAAKRASGPIYVLDLHTTSGSGAPFIVLGDTLRNRRFALQFPVPTILGLEEHIDGTLSEFLTNRGFVAIAVEAGQHQSPDAVRHAEAAVWTALRSVGILVDRDSPPTARTGREILAHAAGAMPRVFEILYRHAISTDDEFRMEPGLRNFDRVTPGQVLARDRHGEIRSRWHGRLVMPLYQRLGSDGFFIARRVLPFWLWLSSSLRCLRLDSILHWLPGVRRHPNRPRTLVLDRRFARWRAMEVLHLLGYRKVRVFGDLLLVSRRRHDLEPNS